MLEKISMSMNFPAPLKADILFLFFIPVKRECKSNAFFNINKRLEKKYLKKFQIFFNDL